MKYILMKNAYDKKALWPGHTTHHTPASLKYDFEKNKNS